MDKLIDGCNAYCERCMMTTVTVIIIMLYVIFNARDLFYTVSQI